jgi:hypothetical protein
MITILKAFCLPVSLSWADYMQPARSSPSRISLGQILRSLISKVFSKARVLPIL